MNISISWHNRSPDGQANWTWLNKTPGILVFCMFESSPNQTMFDINKPLSTFTPWLWSICLNSQHVVFLTPKPQVKEYHRILGMTCAWSLVLTIIWYSIGSCKSCWNDMTACCLTILSQTMVLNLIFISRLFTFDPPSVLILIACQVQFW